MLVVKNLLQKLVVGRIVRDVSILVALHLLLWLLFNHLGGRGLLRLHTVVLFLVEEVTEVHHAAVSRYKLPQLVVFG